MFYDELIAQSTIMALCNESLKMSQKVYDDKVLFKTDAYAWYKLFKEDRQIVIDLPHSGYSTLSTTDKNVNKEIEVKNQLISLREVVCELKISQVFNGPLLVR